MDELYRYLYGWKVWWEFFRKARKKKHGAGGQRFFHATKTAAGARFLVDGQHCQPPRYPHYLRGTVRPQRVQISQM